MRSDIYFFVEWERKKNVPEENFDWSAALDRHLAIDLTV